MEQRILTFAGKKQSGKNTAANFVAGEELISFGILRHFRIDANGNLVTETTLDKEGVLDFTSRNPLWQRWLEEHIWPFVKLYSFADTLKDISINLFGLTEEQCFGTNEQKNSETQYYWKDMFPEVRKKFGFKSLKECGNKKITARQFLQLWGTDVCRKIFNDCWVQATLNKIKYEQVPLALITDCRFPNEALGAQKAKGKVIKLTRNIHNDKHESELALDNFNKFDSIVDNHEMTILEQNQNVKEILTQWGWIV